MPSDRDKGKEAVENVLDTFYQSIGTPAPAPGIERLAFFAVEAAYAALREAWEEDLLSEDAIEAAAEAVDPSWADRSDDHKVVERVVILDQLLAALKTMPVLDRERLRRSAEEDGRG